MKDDEIKKRANDYVQKLTDMQQKKADVKSELDEAAQRKRAQAAEDDEDDGFLLE